MSMSNNTASGTETVMYAVFRNGTRVSDSEYDSTLDAQRELNYWSGIVRRHPDGSKLEIRALSSRCAQQ
jgi:hypothetical protein